MLLLLYTIRANKIIPELPAFHGFETLMKHTLLLLILFSTFCAAQGMAARGN